MKADLEVVRMKTGHQLAVNARDDRGSNIMAVEIRQI